MLDLMLLELYRVSPEQAEAELVFANMEDEDLVFEEGEPGSTFSTKLLGIVTADESSPHVAKLWKKLQEQQMQLEKEGFRLPGGQNFYPRFIERLVSINENSPSLSGWVGHYEGSLVTTWDVTWTLASDWTIPGQVCVGDVEAREVGGQRAEVEAAKVVGAEGQGLQLSQSLENDDVRTRAEAGGIVTWFRFNNQESW